MDGQYSPLGVSESIFHCRAFSLQQGRAAMRVNTDSILLGAWSDPPLDIRRGLDIGTGTGILALMLAQRLPHLQITAIEIDPDASIDARMNFATSPWHDRLVLVEGDVRLWKDTYPDNRAFDLIVANPPYFNSHKEGNHHSRTMARQQVALTVHDLIRLADKLLSPNGQMDMILPYDHYATVYTLVQASKMAIRRKCTVFPRPGKTANRILLSICRDSDGTVEEQITLRERRGQDYSTAYRLLTKEYLLSKDK